MLYELTEIMRQEDEIQFAEVLNRLREGLLTQVDVTYLQQRVFHERDVPADVLRVYSNSVEGSKTRSFIMFSWETCHN